MHSHRSASEAASTRTLAFILVATVLGLFFMAGEHYATERLEFTRGQQCIDTAEARGWIKPQVRAVKP